MKKTKLLFLLLGLSMTALAQKKTVIHVKGEKVSCEDSKECFVVKQENSNDWEVFDNSIKKFNFIPGYEYTLRVKKSGDDYKVKKVLAKNKVEQNVDFEDQKLVLTHVENKAIEGNKVYLRFDSNNNRVSGTTGCNNYNAGYEFEGNVLKIKQGISTMMACESMDLESTIHRILAKENLNVQREGKVVRILENKNPLLVFNVVTKEDELAYIDEKKWELVMFENVGKDFNKAFIKLDTKEKKVNGNTGCNNFFGSFSVSGDQLTFTPLGSTRMACPEGNIEYAFLNHLSDKAVNFDVEGNILTFSNKNGQTIMRFVATN